MKNYRSLVFLVALVVPIIFAQGGFYWRDYKIDLPGDAVPGGVNSYGEPVYIGKTVHPFLFIIPGTIKPAERKIFYEQGGKGHSTNQNVEILCSIHPGKFKWLDVTYQTPIGDVTKNDLTVPYQMVQAWSDPNQALVVGRFKTDDGTVVGKILVTNGMLTHIFGGDGLVRNQYQVLIYDPNVDSDQQLPSCASPLLVTICAD